MTLHRYSLRQRMCGWVLALAVLTASLTVPAAAAQTPTLTQWEIWQIALTTSQAHAWHAFPVTATFTHSSGATLQVDGVFNGTDASGRQAWLIRFAPTRPGAWTWATQSADPSLRAAGTLQVAAPTPAQVAANPNLRGHLQVPTSGPRPGRYFTYADGTPFFWLGDTVWFLNSLRAGIGGGPAPNQNFYTWLADRQRRGFTVALTQLFDLATRNEGGFPFSNNTSVPGNGDFTQLNPEFFKSLDTRLNALHAAGLVVAAHPAWLSELKLSLPDTERIWRYTAARYGAFNVVWSLSGEYQFKYPGTNTWDDASSGGAWSPCWRYDTNAPEPNCQFNRLATTVAGYNVYRHPLSIHPAARLGDNDAPPALWGANAGQQTSGAEFHAQPWLDHNWSQTGHYDSNLFYVWQRTAEDYARAPAKPVIHSEGFYENEKSAGADPYEARWQAWVAFLNGAAGHVYGAGGLWQFYDPAAPEPGPAPYDATPWATALGYPGAGYLQHLGAFFRGLEWWRLEPHRDWLRVNGSPPAAPSANNLTPPHLAANPGQAAVLYLPRGNAGRTIALTNLGATAYNVRVFNPRLGTWAALSPITPSGGAWTVPAAVFADGDDWVIVLTAASLPAPEPTATPTAPGVEAAACPAPVSDDFSRADSTNLGVNWTERQGDWELTANTLRNAASANQLVSWNGGSYGDVSVCAQVQFASLAASTLSLGVRWGSYDGGNLPRQGYNVDVQQNGAVRLMRLQRASSPAVAQLGSTYTIPGFSANAWYSIRVVAQGRALRVEVNGVPRIIATDPAAWPAGEAGVWSDLANAGDHRFDNWSVQALGASPTATATTRPPATATRTWTPTPPPATAARTNTPAPAATAAWTPTQPPATATRTNTRAPGAFTLTVEGEASANTLNGNARVIPYAGASGGQAVGNLGAGPEHWVRFNQITVPEAGVYALTIHYLGGEPRTAFLSLNGEPGAALAFPSPGNGQPVGALTVALALVAGDNTVCIYNDAAYAPDIDRLVVQGPAATTPAP